MKKQSIRILILSISLAMLGLIGLQIYWVSNAVELREQEFDQQVARAMERVIEKHEKQEVFKRIQNHAFGRALMNTIDSIENDYFNGDLIESQILKDTVIYDDQGKYSIEITEKNTLDTVRGVVSSKTSRKFTKELNRIGYEENSDLEYLIGQELSADSMAYLWDLHERLSESKFLQKTDMLNDLVMELVAAKEEVPVEYRIDLDYLDSLIEAELADFGVSADYSFAVVSGLGDRPYLPKCNDEYMEQLEESGYKANIFPSDVVPTPYYLSLFFPHQKSYILGEMWGVLILSILLLLAVIVAFSYTVFSWLKQKKVSEIKNDFISNMTHELKTPISTISLACEALSDKDIQFGEEIRSNYITMIRDENKRLGMLVENVLRTAILEKGELKLKMEPVNIVEVVRLAVKNIEIQVKKKGGFVKLLSGNGKLEMLADQVHMTSVVYNLLENANKYSPNAPEITVSVDDGVAGTKIAVKDNGIGISKEYQQKIFDKLFRVPTGNIHETRGFGLGLAYVKEIVNLHGGKIELNSELGKGSEFIILIPRK